MYNLCRNTSKNIHVYLLFSVWPYSCCTKSLKTQTLDPETDIKNDISFSAENSWIENEETELRSKELSAAISKLSSRQQEILYLKFHSEMDYDHIIEIMGLNYQYARNLVTRALEALRKSMISIFILIFLFIK